SILK
uniref:Cryptide Pep-26 n=1 Tax=Tityus obscurus TaxID=1221240 RepID=CRY26_TITOB